MYDQSMNQQPYQHMQPMGTMGGYYYNGFQGQPTPVQKINNILTPEQIDKLTAQSEFDLGISDEDFNRAICNHRSKDGTQDTLTFDPVTGVARCTICGYTFRPIQSDESSDTIKEAVDKIVDILQTIKILYVDLPPQAHKEIFPMLAMLEKVPKLFEYASKNFSKHESYNWQYSRYNMNGVQMLNNLNNIFGGGMMYQQQPMGMGAPMGTPQYQAPQPNPYANPFGYPGAQPAPQYGQPMMGGQQMGWQPGPAPMPNPAYQAQPYQGFVAQPTQSTTPATPTVEPAATTETAEVTKKVTV